PAVPEGLHRRERHALVAATGKLILRPLLARSPRLGEIALLPCPSSGFPLTKRIVIRGAADPRMQPAARDQPCVQRRLLLMDDFAARMVRRQHCSDRPRGLVVVKKVLIR